MNTFTIHPTTFPQKNSFAPCGSWTASAPEFSPLKSQKRNFKNFKKIAKNAVCLVLLAALWSAFFLVPLMG